VLHPSAKEHALITAARASRPAATRLEERLKTIPYALEVGGFELLRRLREIDDALDHTNQPHHKSGYTTGEHRDQQHDQTRLGVTQHEFVNTEGPQKDSKQAGCQLFVAHLREIQGTPIAVAHASPGRYSPLVAI